MSDEYDPCEDPQERTGGFETWLTPLSTGDGGQPTWTVDDLPDDGDESGHPGSPDAPAGAQPVENRIETDLAKSALADARNASRGRPRRPDRGKRRRNRNDNLAGRNRGGYSGPGPDTSSDPQRVGSLFGRLIEDQGWERPLAEGRVFAAWAELVGADVAAHSDPQSLHDGELRIIAESTAWATQLRLLSAALLARLVAELGPHVVTKLVITGPVAPSWKHGGRSVRGARGPRDTYG